MTNDGAQNVNLSWVKFISSVCVIHALLYRSCLTYSVRDLSVTHSSNGRKRNTMYTSKVETENS